MLRTLVFALILLFSSIVRAQDTLPRFSVTAKGPGKILISWHNRYTTVSQISIQRSLDSLKYFTTLLTVPDPHLPENGAMLNVFRKSGYKPHASGNPQTVHLVLNLV